MTAEQFDAYVDQLERRSDAQDWEGDLFEWEYDVEVLAEWRDRYQKLLTPS